MRQAILILVLLAACQPVATRAALPTSETHLNTPVPTLNLQPSRSPSLISTATAIASPTRSVWATPQPTSTEMPSATPGQQVASGVTHSSADDVPQIVDHYVFARPFSEPFSTWILRAYPYGGTDGGRLQVHRGDDLVNPAGTPILAAADGTVIYAGDDLTTMFGPQNNYYGNLVVIQHNFLSPEGLPVFTLYGHMLQVLVKAGATVREGQTIGLVGATGIALGPHLHFEVRVGNPFDFNATRNPELWLRPYRNFGTLAGRVTDANGNLLYNVRLTVQSDAIRRTVDSYADNSVRGDSVFGENYVTGDLPAGNYTVTVSSNGWVRFQQSVYVYPDRTNWLEVRLSR